MGKEQDWCTCSPDKILWLDLSPYCKAHDEHYRDHDVSREEADIQLRENIKAEGGLLAFVVAWIYFFGVRLFGSSHY